MMKKTWFAAMAAAVVATAAPAGAQVFTPSFATPYPGNELGVYVNDGPGDISIEGIWRRGTAGGDFGIRAGYADIADEGALMVGLELRNPVVLAGAPIGLAFTASAQGILGDGIGALGGQVGFSAGQRLNPAGANFTLTPYIHPRLALLTGVGNAETDDEFDIEVLADVGLEFGFANGVAFRLAGNLSGEGADWGLGLSFRQ